jgi:RimJ/RimL family protein N-acetyltransferase
VLVRLGQEVQEVPRRLAAPDPPLADGELHLEPLTSADAGALNELAEDPDVRRFTYVPTEPPADLGERWAARYAEGWEDGSRAGFSIRGADGSSLGMAGFVRLDLDARQGEIGYIVAPAARGRGVGARALRLLAEWGLETLRLARIELRIDVENRASEAVAARAGFVREGVLRSLHFKEGLRADVGVWSRVRGR